MRISKKSTTHDRDNPFRSRFEGDGDSFPLRQMLRCREEFVQRCVLSVVQTGFGVALVMLGMTIHRAFVRHGADAPGWVEPVSLGLVAFVLLLVVRRVVNNVREAVALRGEIRRYREEFKDAQNRS